MLSRSSSLETWCRSASLRDRDSRTFQIFLLKIVKKKFRALMRVVQPNYEVKDMRYYSDRVLPQLYERVKERVKTALDSASAVAFSSDVRSDDTGNSFLSCTAHCIDPVKLKPTHFAIGIFPFKKDGRISSIIFHNIMDCLKEFGVERERRLIFVLDPVSNITATRIMLDLPVINCYTNSIELVRLMQFFSKNHSNFSQSDKVLRKWRPDWLLRK